MKILIFAFLLPFVASQTTHAPPSCVDVEDHTFIGAAYECYIYYECIEGVAFRLQCPRGLYFSTSQQSCVYYDESDCGLSPPPPALPTCDDVDEFGLIPSDIACDLYFMCIEGSPFQLKCPRGYYFSFERQNCVLPDESDCSLIQTTPGLPTTVPPPSPTPPTQDLPTCDDVDEFGLIPSIDGCNYYFMCFDSQQFLLQCPRGYYFSFDNQNCGAYEDSGCAQWDITRPTRAPEDEAILDG